MYIVNECSLVSLLLAVVKIRLDGFVLINTSRFDSSWLNAVYVKWGHLLIIVNLINNPCSESIAISIQPSGKSNDISIDLKTELLLNLFGVKRPFFFFFFSSCILFFDTCCNYYQKQRSANLSATQTSWSQTFQKASDIQLETSEKQKAECVALCFERDTLQLSCLSLTHTHTPSACLFYHDEKSSLLCVDNTWSPCMREKKAIWCLPESGSAPADKEFSSEQICHYD